MLGLAPTAAAGPVTAAPVPAPVSRCTVTDPRLGELSGLAVVDGASTGRGAVWAMSDGGRQVELLRLDPATCAVVDRRTADVDPYDPEDLAAGPDGSLWVGDIGDNDRRRATVAVIVVPRQGPAQLHRLTYPDGPHDAEALLVDGRGVATVVTKTVEAAGVYQPEGPITGPGPVPLVHVADVVLPSADTRGGPLGSLGSLTVTGGAVSADGRVVALRTYTDAWLFPVPDPGEPGAIAAALRGTPVRVPLPDEPQGEAVAFTADGTLLSGSESRPGARGELRAVTGAAALAAAAPAEVAPPATAGPSGPPPPGQAPDTAPDASWRPALLGLGALTVVLVLLAAAMVRDGVRRR